ncbi:MAG: hypothetical protein HY537_10110 [Deltaproteobacteria bacterium]|nr:hypothetical protein [Deltaproteobacteria bacterium]
MKQMTWLCWAASVLVLSSVLSCSGFSGSENARIKQLLTSAFGNSTAPQALNTSAIGNSDGDSGQIAQNDDPLSGVGNDITDHDDGYIESADETRVDTTVIRTCSVGRSIGPNPFIEELAAPLLTIEVSGRLGNSLPPTANYVLGKYDLKGKDFNHSVQLNTIINYQNIKRDYPNSWQSLRAILWVCDDSEHTGICSNKPINKVVSIRNYIPVNNLVSLHAASVSVFANRNKTQRANPALCDSQMSPLVLSFGRSIETLAAVQGPLFDLDADGEPERLGWIRGHDSAFLSLDRNHNGTIDDGSELFGNYTHLRNGSLAPNGFSALMDLDSNQDGFMDTKDEVWSQLKLWFDKNSDGKTDAGELLPLQYAGVVSIDLHYENIWEQSNGNQTRQRSLFKMKDGGTHLIVDIWFGSP